MKRIREFAENASDNAPALEGTTTEYDVSCYYSARLDEACTIILALAEVAEKADKFDERLTYVEGHPNYKSVWAINQAHCGPYQGPTYTKEIEWLRSAITALDEKVGEILK